MNTLDHKVQAWAIGSLTSLGYTLKNNMPEIILNPPWSCIARFETTKHAIYLKKTPEKIALEANVIKTLQHEFNAPVASIIAHSIDLHCFLMQDSGGSLRAMLKKNFDIQLLCKAVDDFTQLQQVIAKRVEVLLGLGVPDWQLDKIPSLYKHALSQSNLLMQFGLSESDIHDHLSVLPEINNLCAQLSEYNIPQTLVQPDFSDNNVLINENTQQLTIIDLGEIVISHPFFSLSNCLFVVKKHHGLADKDKHYTQLHNTCFKAFTSNLPRGKRLEDAVAITGKLWFVYSILSQLRLIHACETGTILAFQPDKLRNTFRQLYAVCKNQNRV